MRILCFGDSNTWGAVPMSTLDAVSRWPEHTSWPGVLQAHMGLSHQVINEGRSGRTLCHDDPEEGQHLNGLDEVQDILDRHAPLDVVILMLGTNDHKRKFQGGEPFLLDRLQHGMATMVQHLQASTDVRANKRRVLVVIPPHVRERGPLSEMFMGGEALSQAHCPHLMAWAAKLNTDVLDANEFCQTDAIDGIHLNAHAHASLGKALADRIQSW